MRIFNTYHCIPGLLLTKASVFWEISNSKYHRKSGPFFTWRLICITSLGCTCCDPPCAPQWLRRNPPCIPSHRLAPGRVFFWLEIALEMETEILFNGGIQHHQKRIRLIYKKIIIYVYKPPITIVNSYLSRKPPLFRSIWVLCPKQASVDLVESEICQSRWSWNTSSNQPTMFHRDLR